MSENKEIEKELNLDQKVTIRNLAGWQVGFRRKADNFGDVHIAPNGTTRLSRNEIIAQVQDGNKLFTGVDGAGSHATIFIDDAPTRIECDFETEDGSVTQNILTEKKIEEMFKTRGTAKFESSFKSAVVTRAEKFAAIRMIKNLNLNDYTKIRFAEEYTGFKL